MSTDPYSRASAIYRDFDRSETIRFGLEQSNLGTAVTKSGTFGSSGHVSKAALIAYDSLKRHVDLILDTLATFHAENGGALTSEINQTGSTLWARDRLKQAIAAKRTTLKSDRTPESAARYTDLVDREHAANARQLLDSKLQTFFSEANPTKPADWVERGRRAARAYSIDLTAAVIKKMGET